MDFSDFEQASSGNSAADADLSGMSKKDAHEYVKSYATSLKTLQNQRKEAEERLEQWKERARLAYEKSDRELARVALEKWEKAKADVQRLRGEEQELSRTVELLKANYEKIKRTPEMSVDAEALNTQLENLVGSSESRKTDEALRNIELDSQLEQLRQKMQQEDNK